MRRRKKYKLEFLTGIFEEWRFYTISEKMLVRSKEYEKAMKATYELVNKVKSRCRRMHLKILKKLLIRYVQRTIYVQDLHMVWVFMMGWNCIKSYR